MLEAARELFTRQTSPIRQRLLSGAAIASDETGLRIGRKSGWLWIFHHDANAIFIAAMTRVKSVVADLLGAGAPTSGCPTAMAANSDGPKRTIRSASPTSSATPNTSSIRATMLNVQLGKTSAEVREFW